MAKSKMHILTAIKNLKRQVFTTRDMASCCGSSLSNIVQALNRLEKNGAVIKISQGIWGFGIGRETINPFSAVPYLMPSHRAYVSFVSALHLHGIIEQIPQTITLASTAHTKVIKTTIGVFHIHRIAPSFFKGFDWYNEEGEFLIAEPEKALVDCFYLAARKKKQFGHFPELNFPRKFSWAKAGGWARMIADSRIRVAVLKRLKEIRAT